MIVSDCGCGSGAPAGAVSTAPCAGVTAGKVSDAIGARGVTAGGVIAGGVSGASAGARAGSIQA